MKYIKQEVTSDVIQGSVLGPSLFNILFNPLFSDLGVIAMALTDDLKLIVIATYSEVQRTQRSSIKKFENFSASHHMLICIDKYAVMLGLCKCTF